MSVSVEAYLDSGIPYVAYGAAKALGDGRAAALKERMYADPGVLAVARELRAWPGPRLSSHKSARQFFHKLAFLADIGVEADHPGLAPAYAAIMDGLDDDGVPLLPLDPAAAGRGAGGRRAIGDQSDAAVPAGDSPMGWALCDAPTTLYALRVMGYRDERLDRAATKLAGTSRDNGWGCVVSESLSYWRGPGKKADPCPYATLAMTKLLLAYGEGAYDERVGRGADCLMRLWRESLDEHPYMFYMGTDFRKLKLPFIWYDVLHVLEVLSRAPSIKAAPALAEMASLVLGKETGGGFVPESAYLEWKGWDFGQKKAPSEWLGLRIAIIRRKLGRL